PYVSVLEEWDDLVGEDWEQPISNFLNPSDWLVLQPYDEYSGRIKKILDIAFNSTKEYLKQFNEYLMVKFFYKDILGKQTSRYRTFFKS
ncbi:MAG: hypothetical protein ACK56F_04755, partial [bacterium]